MKKALMPAAAIFLLAALAWSCACSQEEEEGPVWEKLDDVSELSMPNPVKAFKSDWMVLAVGDSTDMNAMTISWGELGELWGKDVMTVFVSSDRFTKSMLDDADYFTVAQFPDSSACREAMAYLGSHSKADEPDKFANAGLTASWSELGNPIINEADQVIECKKLYSDEFNKDLMPKDVKKLYDNMGVHTFYIGEIVNVWNKSLNLLSEKNDTIQ